jgi:RNA polymerase sigma-70 factor, ECF subfamily
MEEFENYRQMLFGIAYRMLGSAMDAEDIVQETFLRYQAAQPGSIRSPQHYLSTIATRLCLDQIKSSHSQREQYPGPWLPEPVFSADIPDIINPDERVVDFENVSIAFLTLLESLSPAERAVFVLHQVFDYSFAEVAGILEKSEAACRQLSARSLKHIQESRPRFSASTEDHQRLTESFLRATETGALDELMGSWQRT